MADQAGQAHGAEVDERHAEAAAVHAERGVGRGDAQVAPQRQLEPASDRRALDGGDDGLAEPQPGRPHRAGAGLADGRRSPSASAFRSAPAQKHPPAAGEHGDARRLVGVERLEGVEEQGRGHRIDGVAPLGTVDRRRRAPGRRPSPARGRCCVIGPILAAADEGASTARMRPDCDREAAALPDVRERGVLRFAQLRALPDGPGPRRRRRRRDPRSRTSRPTQPCCKRDTWACNWLRRRSGRTAVSQLRARRRRRPPARGLDGARSSRPNDARCTSSASSGVPWGAGSELRFSYRSKSARRRRRHRPPQRRDHARPRRGRPGQPGADPLHARRALPHAARPHPPRARPLRVAQAGGLGPRPARASSAELFGDERSTTPPRSTPTTPGSTTAAGATTTRRSTRRPTRGRTSPSRGPS